MALIVTDDNGVEHSARRVATVPGGLLVYFEDSKERFAPVWYVATGPTGPDRDGGSSA